METGLGEPTTGGQVSTRAPPRGCSFTECSVKNVFDQPMEGWMGFSPSHPFALFVPGLACRFWVVR